MKIVYAYLPQSKDYSWLWLTLLVCIAKFKTAGFKTKLYTNEDGFKIISKLKIDVLFSEIDTHTIANSIKNIDTVKYWAVAKLVAIQNEVPPFVCIDLDVIVWDPIKMMKLIDNNYSVMSIHPEDTSEINSYKSQEYLYQHYPKHDWLTKLNWNETALNAAITVWTDAEFKNQYIKRAFELMLDDLNTCEDNASLMIFVEQHLPTIMAHNLNKKVGFLLESPQDVTNRNITHLWGYKNHLVNNFNLQRELENNLILILNGAYSEQVESIINGTNN